MAKKKLIRIQNVFSRAIKSILQDSSYFPPSNHITWKKRKKEPN